MRQQLWIVAVSCGLMGCETSRSEEDRVLDAIVVSTDRVFAAIEEDGTAWLVAAAQGSEVNGSLDNGTGGTVAVVGWRSGANHVASEGHHHAFSEKIFLSYSNWPDEGMVMNGSLTITRHSHDFGPPEGDIEDANRTTTYQGSLSTSGEIGGSFQIDVHALASGATLWTCGLINESEIGHGACF